MTHTYAELDVSPETYDEIAVKLRAVKYDHSFMEDGTINMHGIGLVRSCHRDTSDAHSIRPVRGPHHLLFFLFLLGAAAVTTFASCLVVWYVR